jgi:hypothetical protein
VAGLLFLTYPSHSEAILWVIGRGVSLAVFFSLLAMIAFISRINRNIKYAVVCVLYFIALACYESVLLLPLVLFTLSRTSSKKQHFTWSLLLLTILLMHLYLRYLFTGGIWQAYDRIIFGRDLIQYLSAFVKMVLRLFIPPFNYPLIFTICGIAAVGFISLVLYRNRKTFESDSLFARVFVLCITGLLVTIVVAISFGVSTRTSEGDRLMYLPSVFYAMLMALLICTVLKSVGTIAISITSMLVFQVSFLLINQENWNHASQEAKKIISSIKQHSVRPLYIINLPSDYKGAFVFRNCFNEALLFHNIDTAGVRIVNVVQSTEMEKKQTLIVAEKQADDIFVWPNTLLETNNGKVVRINHDSTANASVPLNCFLYWNKRELVPLNK